MKTIKIATRKSKLALWQAQWVKSRLEEAGLNAELIPINTKGDQQLDISISKIGSKGVFTEELEELLQNGEADIAVHSAKDLAAELPNGFDVISVGERGSANDVLVANDSIDLNSPLKIGTSSTRRVAQMAKHYPHFEVTPIRGNLQTRLEKMSNGECDALMLAKVGVERMEMIELIQYQFDLEEITPAAGQGCIAIEAYESIHPTIRKLIKAATNDTVANTMTLTERTFLRHFGGGCSIPVFSHARGQQDLIRLRAGILSLDGSEVITTTDVSDDPVELGKKVAEKLLKEGGEKILTEIKNQLG